MELTFTDRILLSRPKPRNYRPGVPYVHGEHKLDGHRMCLVRAVDGRVTVVGRKLEVDWWAGRLEKHAGLAGLVASLPPGTIVDGELFAEDRPATDVRSLLCGDELDVQALTYQAFAVPAYDGDDWRFMPLLDARARLAHMGFAIPAAIERQSRTGLDEAGVEELRRMCRRLRVEGVVLKQGHWSGWWKVKPTRTLDAVVTGVLPGTGKHHGRVGALMITLFQSDGTRRPVGKVGTGFSDRERELPESWWVGRVVEVEYDSVAARGDLRFSCFLRTRDDKPPHECSASQLGEQE